MTNLNYDHIPNFSLAPEIVNEPGQPHSQDLCDFCVGGYPLLPQLSSIPFPEPRIVPMAVQHWQTSEVKIHQFRLNVCDLLQHPELAARVGHKWELRALEAKNL